MKILIPILLGIIIVIAIIIVNEISIKKDVDEISVGDIYCPNDSDYNPFKNINVVILDKKINLAGITWVKYALENDKSTVYYAAAKEFINYFKKINYY